MWLTLTNVRTHKHHDTNATLRRNSCLLSLANLTIAMLLRGAPCSYLPLCIHLHAICSCCQTHLLRRPSICRPSRCECHRKLPSFWPPCPESEMQAALSGKGEVRPLHTTAIHVLRILPIATTPRQKVRAFAPECRRPGVRVVVLRVDAITIRHT